MTDEALPPAVDRRDGGNDWHRLVCNEVEEAVGAATVRQEILPAPTVMEQNIVVRIAYADQNGRRHAGDLRTSSLETGSCDGRGEQGVPIDHADDRKPCGRRRMRWYVDQDPVFLPLL